MFQKFIDINLNLEQLCVFLLGMESIKNDIGALIRLKTIHLQFVTITFMNHPISTPTFDIGGEQ